MDNMISVINDNLKNVVNGIKTHKGEINAALDKVKADMDDKADIAERFKQDVEESKTTIANLENEISTLEKDLEELTEKFGDNFKETVAAGNKEINSKIIKDRAAISAEAKRIEELTAKARLIKDELVDLKDKKDALEANLSDTRILEGYYGKRIESIIDYSLQHTGDLESFQEEEVNLDLITNLNNINDKDLSNNIDGSVFSEIDDISDKDLADVKTDSYDLSDIASDEFEDEAFSVTKQLDTVISEAKAIADKFDADDYIAEEPVEEEIEEEPLEEEPLKEEPIEEEGEAAFEEPIADAIEEEVSEDDIIDPDNDYSAAFNLSSLKPLEDDSIDISVDDDLEDKEIDESHILKNETEEEELVPFDNDSLEALKEYDKHTEDYKEFEYDSVQALDDYDKDSSKFIPFDNEHLDTLQKENVEEFEPFLTNDEISQDNKDTIDNILVSINDFVKDDKETPEDSFDLDSISDINKEDDIDLDEMPVYEGTKDDDYYDETTKELADLVKGIKEHEDSYSKNMDFTIPDEEDEEGGDISPIDDIVDATIADNEDNIYGMITKHGLSTNSFDADKLVELDAKATPAAFDKLISVLDEHHINKEALYTNPDLIALNNPELVDEVLTELDKTEATENDIKLVLNKVDKIDMNKLKDIVAEDAGDDLTSILYKTMPSDTKDDIGKRLNLNKSEVKKLKANTSDEEFKMMNMFADIVATNYNTLASKNVDKPKECFVEHPHRFLFNPDRFNAILDKYDDEDLVRCINKNSAVIDRL